jgi:hypothetical protein
MKSLLKLMAAAALAVTVVLPQIAVAGDVGGTGTVGAANWRKHIYVFHPGLKSLVTYSTVHGTVEVYGLQTMSFGQHPTLKDKAGNACYGLDATAWPGDTVVVHWQDDYATGGGPGEEHDLVLGDSSIVICDEQLPNHDQLPYPPD